MSLLQALAHPLRNPLRMASLALVQSLFLWMLILGFSYLDRSSSGQTTFVAWMLLLISLVLNPIWLFRYTVATLQFAMLGERRLPLLRISHLRPKGIRPFFSSLILVLYFGYIAALIAGMPYVASLYHFDLNLIALVRLACLLASQSVIVAICSLLSLIYFVGLARYAVEGGGGAVAAFRANQLIPSRYPAKTAKHLLLQVLLLGMTTILVGLGSEAVYEMRPRGLGYSLEDWRVAAWAAFGIFCFLCVYLTFWIASLHLLAQYAKANGICGDGYKLKKGKDKFYFT